MGVVGGHWEELGSADATLPGNACDPNGAACDGIGTKPGPPDHGAKPGNG